MQVNLQHALHWCGMWVIMMMAMQVKCDLHTHFYQHGFSVTMSYIWVSKCHITMVISFHNGQLSSCECVHRCLCKYSASTSASTLQVSADLHRFRVYKGVGTLGDSPQTPVREGSSLLTRKLRGWPCACVSNLVVDTPHLGREQSLTG